MRKEKEDLNQEENQILARLFQWSPNLKTAYELQNSLTAIFDAHISVEVAKVEIEKWLVAVFKSGLDCFNAGNGQRSQSIPAEARNYEFVRLVTPHSILRHQRLFTEV